MSKVMNKGELIEALTEKGIEHDPNATNKDLLALLQDAPEESKEEETPEAEAPVEEPKVEPKVEPKAEPKDRGKVAKKEIPPTGSPDVEVKRGQVLQVLAEDSREKELLELQADKRLVGWNPVTREAVFWKD